ncbi:MAG TPA: SMC-Scp complex subunit ScpB [Candidatus Brocadiia bacterium]|nr:SMC-Scp complex subunit ScpB [Candidatus Brocadiia bacterium]
MTEEEIKHNQEPSARTDQAEPEPDKSAKLAEQPFPEAPEETAKPSQEDAAGPESVPEDAQDEKESEEEPEEGVETETMPAEQLSASAMKAVVEAILFVCDDPIHPKKIRDIIGCADTRQIRGIIKVLQEEYAAGGHAFQIEEIAGGYKMMTLPEYHPWVARLKKTVSEARLSQAAIETLAIVAYRQPILRADIEAVRGVQCGPMLRTLIEKGLVKVVGHDEQLGRPLLYGTTDKFLEQFGLASLKDLPSLEELRPRE